MRIAVAAVDAGVESAVEERFGRAPVFVVHDTETGETISITNGENAAAAHGAGTGSASDMVARKVDVVVSGRLGPKAEQVLTASGIRFVARPSGTVAEAIEFVKNEQAN